MTDKNILFIEGSDSPGSMKDVIASAVAAEEIAGSGLCISNEVVPEVTSLAVGETEDKPTKPRISKPQSDVISKSCNE